MVLPSSLIASWQKCLIFRPCYQGKSAENTLFSIPASNNSSFVYTLILLSLTLGTGYLLGAKLLLSLLIHFLCNKLHLTIFCVANHTLQDASHTVGAQQMLLRRVRQSFPFTQYQLQKLMSTNKISLLPTKCCILITGA